VNSKHQAAKNRLIAAGYTPMKDRPKCANCAHAEVRVYGKEAWQCLTKHYKCNLHRAEVIGQSICGGWAGKDKE